MKRGGDNNKHSNKTQETTVKGTTDSTNLLQCGARLLFLLATGMRIQYSKSSFVQHAKYFLRSRPLALMIHSFMCNYYFVYSIFQYS